MDWDAKKWMKEAEKRWSGANNFGKVAGEVKELTASPTSNLILERIIILIQKNTPLLSIERIGGKRIKIYHKKGDTFFYRIMPYHRHGCTRPASKKFCICEKTGRGFWISGVSGGGDIDIAIMDSPNSKSVNVNLY